MNITVNGQPVYIDPEMIGFILPIVLPILFFVFFSLIIGFSIRAAVKKVGKQLPKGTLRKIQAIHRQFPKGTNWQELMANWDIKIDKETGKVKIKKKSTAGESSLSPTEMRVTHLSQLPGAMRQMIGQIKVDQPKERPQSNPASNMPQKSTSPFINEGVSTIGRIALAILILGLLYGLGKIFG